MISPMQVREDYATVLEWLCVEMQRRQIVGKIYTNAVTVEHEPLLRHPIVIVPVHIANCTHAWTYAVQLQELESAWNEQEPEPEWILSPPGRKAARLTINQQSALYI